MLVAKQEKLTYFVPYGTKWFSEHTISTRILCLRHRGSQRQVRNKINNSYLKSNTYYGKYKKD